MHNLKVVDSSQKNISLAIDIINQGGVVILPADTVYGFFASATNQKAVERVYKIKAREKRKPFVIYTNANKVNKIGELNSTSKKLINKFWPKALSLVVKKKEIIPDWFTNNGPTVAVMTAQNKVISKIIEEVNEPILGTTCNISGEPELKKAHEVYRFIEDVDLIIADDNIPIYNKPSTMINCLKEPAEIIRVSSIPEEEIWKVIPDAITNLQGAIK